MLIEQPLRHVHVAIGVDADEVAIGGRKMKLRERDAIGDHWLPEQLEAHNTRPAAKTAA